MDKKGLSQIVADLFVKSKGGEELSSKLHLLRDEIKKVIEGEDTIFGKLRGLEESFREIIPEEKQRYNAAIKALSTTSKLSQHEIVKAVDNQLEELKILEKGLLSTIPGWRDELKAMEAKSREIRDEISKLREKIGQLESEEKVILKNVTGQEKAMELVEKAVGELFTAIGAEITDVKTKVGKFAAESPAQPIPPEASLKSAILSEEKGGGEQKSEILESSAPIQDTEWQKKCPMCGGRMDFYSPEEKWQCYSCGYEELKKNEVRGKDEEISEPANAPEPTPASEPISDPSPSLAVPLADLSSTGSLWSNERSSRIATPKQAAPSDKQPTKKKTCPVCRKKMGWYDMEKAWRCTFCGYERGF